MTAPESVKLKRPDRHSRELNDEGIEMFMLTEKQMVDVVEAVNAAYDFLDGYVDVVDGSYGEPAPNKAMSLQQCLGEVQNTLDKAMNAPSEIERLRAALVEIAPPEGLTMEQAMAWLRQHAKGFAAGRKFEREMRGPVAPQDSAPDAREAVARMLVPYWLGGFERQERNERGHWEYPPYTPNARAYEIADKALAIIAARHSQEVTTEINEETLADLICDAEERLGPGCDEQAIAQAILAKYDVRAKR
jgi:hypothetical protein